LNHPPSTGDKLRRATQLWHAYLAGMGTRFDLAQFMRDATLEKQVLDGALASGNAKLISLAQDWLREPGQSSSAPAARTPSSTASPVNSPAESPKKQRYLKGVR